MLVQCTTVGNLFNFMKKKVRLIGRYKLSGKFALFIPEYICIVLYVRDSLKLQGMTSQLRPNSNVHVQLTDTSV